MSLIPLTITSPSFLPSVPRENKKAPSPQAGPAEEPPLSELFGDNDDWTQLLHSFGERSQGTLRLCWSPPPSPSGSPTPPTPRIVRQISISETSALQPVQGHPEPRARPRSPPGLPPGAGDRAGLEEPEGQDGQDGGSKRPVDARDLEAGPEAPFLRGSPEALAGESSSVGVLLPSEVGPSPQGAAPPPPSPAASRRQIQAPDLGDKSPWPGPGPAKLPVEGDVLAEGLERGLRSRGASALPEGSAERPPSPEAAGQAPNEQPVQGAAPLARPERHSQVLGLDGLSTHGQGAGEPFRPEKGNSGHRGQQDPEWEQAHEAGGLEARDTEPLQQGDPPPDASQAPAGTQVPAPGTTPPSPRGSALSVAGARGPAVGASEATGALLTLADTQAQPVSTSAGGESKPGGPQPTQPGPAGRPEDLRTEAASSPGDLAPSKPHTDPDYLFHVIFLGDSNVGKTSFLHLLHHDAFATGLTATVGKVCWGGGPGLGLGDRGGPWLGPAVSEQALPGDVAAPALATGLHEAFILCGHNLGISLIVSNYGQFAFSALIWVAHNVPWRQSAVQFRSWCWWRVENRPVSTHVVGSSLQSELVTRPRSASMPWQETTGGVSFTE